MQSILNVEVSCFFSYLSTIPTTINLLDWLTSDEHAAAIQKLRELDDKSERDAIKASLPAITMSGIFQPTRKEENLVKHSGLICIDIDAKDNEHILNFADLKTELFKLENVAYAGLSASGKGFFLIIPIAYPKRHKQHFRAIQRDLEIYGLYIDPAPQNVASLRGYSYDENGLFRHDAKPYRKWGRAKSQQSSFSFSPSEKATGTKEKVETVISKLIQQRIDITQSEPDWFRLACALANEFGESGRDYFHAISQFHAEYDSWETDRKYDHALKGRYNSIRLGTFFKLANAYLC